MAIPFTDEGIVLSRREYAEADRILTVLTREHGKIGVIARGARRSKSKYGGYTDLFSHNFFGLVKGRGELYTMTVAQRAGKRRNFEGVLRSSAAALCAQITDSLVIDTEPLDSKLFDLVSSAFDACADPSQNPRLAVVWLGRRLLKISGYGPSLQVCALCGQQLEPVDAYFDVEAGGILCSKCASTLGRRRAIATSLNAIKVLRLIDREDETLYWKLNVARADLDTLDEIMAAEVSEHAEKRLGAYEMYRDFFRAS